MSLKQVKEKSLFLLFSFELLAKQYVVSFI
jgi:hypothetical protein